MKWYPTPDGIRADGGRTIYRIVPYIPGTYLLDCWSGPFGGWAMLGKTDTLAGAQQFAECEEAYREIGVS